MVESTVGCKQSGKQSEDNVINKRIGEKTGMKIISTISNEIIVLKIKVFPVWGFHFFCGEINC